MPIVLISESLLLRSTVADGRILRDRQLCGFCVRMNARKRSFTVATSVAGKQFRMVLGHWPLKFSYFSVKHILDLRVILIQLVVSPDRKVAFFPAPVIAFGLNFKAQVGKKAVGFITPRKLRCR